MASTTSRVHNKFCRINQWEMTPSSTQIPDLPSRNQIWPWKIHHSLRFSHCHFIGDVNHIIWTTGWWLTYPSKKWWSSSVGMMTFPTEWTNKTCSKPPTRLWNIAPISRVYSMAVITILPTTLTSCKAAFMVNFPRNLEPRPSTFKSDLHRALRWLSAICTWHSHKMGSRSYVKLPGNPHVHVLQIRAFQQIMDDSRATYMIYRYMN